MASTTKFTSASTHKMSQRSHSKTSKPSPVFDLTSLSRHETTSHTATMTFESFHNSMNDSSWGSIDTEQNDLDDLNSSWGSISTEVEEEEEEEATTSNDTMADDSLPSLATFTSSRRSSSLTMSNSLLGSSSMTATSRNSGGSTSLLGDFQLEDEQDEEEDVVDFDTTFLQTERRRRRTSSITTCSSSRVPEITVFCSGPSQRRVPPKDLAQATEAELCLKTLYSDYQRVHHQRASRAA